MAELDAAAIGMAAPVIAMVALVTDVTQEIVTLLAISPTESQWVAMAMAAEAAI